MMSNNKHILILRDALGREVKHTPEQYAEYFQGKTGAPVDVQASRQTTAIMRLEEDEEAA
jgi:hypothetical protein